MKKRDLIVLRKSVIKDALQAVHCAVMLPPDGFWYDPDENEIWEGDEVIEARKAVFECVEDALRQLESSEC